MSKRPKIARFVGSIVASMVAISVLAQVKGGSPRLVVGIVVDQLRADYVDRLQELMTRGGFNRLRSQGLTIRHLDYGPLRPDAASATASLLTGTQPYVHGIPSKLIFDRSSQKTLPILQDKNYLGNFTTDTYSPTALKVSSLADEWIAEYGHRGRAYSIAADAQVALLLAGHQANSAFWIDDATGRWCTTTYYSELPKPAQERNYKASLAMRLDTIQWRPVISVATLTQVVNSTGRTAFRYTFEANRPNRFQRLKASPLANDEVATLAQQYIDQLNLGNQTNGHDMLTVGLSAAPYQYGNAETARLELADIYLRLDRAIERIVQAVDRRVGLQNALIYVASSGTPQELPPTEAVRIPTGTFDVQRASSLLNVYLIALYGNGQWVQGYANGQFYLNTQLIEQHQISKETIMAQCATFLRKMQGVISAFPVSALQADPNSALARNLYGPSAGDVLVEVNPGWNEYIPATANSSAQTHYITAATYLQPLYILSPEVQRSATLPRLDVRQVAPTIAGLLHIRSPNAAGLPALELR